MSLALAISNHTAAIARWGDTLSDVMSNEFMAQAVENARAASIRACEKHMYGGFHPLGTHVQPIEDILAACRDAEAKAAIDAHAEAIKLLVK